MSGSGGKRNVEAIDDGQYGLDEFDLEKAYTFHGDIALKLKQTGLANAQRPFVTTEVAHLLHIKEGEYFDGQLPSSLKNLSMEGLSDLHILMASWIHYLTVLLNDVLLERSEATSKKEAIWSFVRIFHKKYAKKYQGLNLTDQQASDLARYDARFVNANNVYVKLTAHRDCLTALLKVAEQNCAVVSREVTRRETSLNTATRSSNIEQNSAYRKSFMRNKRGDVYAQQEKEEEKSKRRKSKFAR